MGAGERGDRLQLAAVGDATAVITPACSCSVGSVRGGGDNSACFMSCAPNEAARCSAGRKLERMNENGVVSV